MKNSLENILNIAKIALASSLSAISLYAQQPFQIKTTNGNWNEKAPAILYFESNLGNIGTDPKKDPTKQFKSSVYFSGKRKAENKLEISYITTDQENPSPDSPTIDNNRTKILYFCEANDNIEIEYQKAIMMNNVGKIRFEDTVPKEKANSTLMKFGINLTDKASQKIEDYIMLQTGGLLEIDVKEGLTKYCENQTRKIIDTAKETTGYELAINNALLWTRDKNSTIRDKQIGWVIGLSASSKKKEVPLAFYFHLELEKENEQEKGTLNAYTQAFTIPAKLKQMQTCQNIENLENQKIQSPKTGLYTTKDYDSFIVIREDGKLFSIENSKLKECFVIKSLYSYTNKPCGSIYYAEIESNKRKGILEVTNLDLIMNSNPEQTKSSFKKGERVKILPDKPKEEKTSPGLVDKIPSGNKEVIRNLGKLFGK